MVKFIQIFKRKTLRENLSGQKQVLRNLDDKATAKTINSAKNNLSLYDVCTKLQADIVKALSGFIQISSTVRRNTDETALFNHC